MVVQVAVLDDYQNFAPAHFDKLSGSTFAVRYFPETLRPYDHPDTPQHIKDELVSRLEPFEVICKPSHHVGKVRSFKAHMAQLR